MAGKKYFLTQTINLDGQKKSRGFSVFADITDIDKIAELMEGKITVKEATKVINPTGDNTSIASSEINFVSSIVATTDLPKGGRMPIYINSYDKASLMFKKTSDAKKIRELLLTVKLCEDFPDLKPTSVTVKDSTR